MSTDIDVLLPEHDNVVEGHEGGRYDVARATDGKVEAEWEDRIKVTLPGGAIDICAAPPMMPGLEKREEVEGHEETVLGSAQILRGKPNHEHCSWPQTA